MHRGEAKRFLMQPYRALFAVTHRNESRTGFEIARARKTLILRRKRVFIFSDVKGIPRPNRFYAALSSPCFPSVLNETRMG